MLIRTLLRRFATKTSIEQKIKPLAPTKGKASIDGVSDGERIDSSVIAHLI